MKRTTFWLTSLAAALGLGLLLAFAFPYGLIGLDAPADRNRGWLLTLWTSGVMAICFGASGLLSSMNPLGFRDVADVGSVSAALEARREARQRQQEAPFYNFAGWTVMTGVFLLMIYFGAWLSMGR